MADLDKLEELAKAATAGPWDWRGKDGGLYQVGVDRPYGKPVLVPSYEYDSGVDTTVSDADAAFIAAANPATVLELIALARRDGVSGAVAVTADTVRNTITCFLTADDPTHWGEFERRLAVAVGMPPSTAEDACIAGGELRCVNAHDRCYEGGSCPYCEPADPRPDPLEALREATEGLVYYSKAEAYGRRIILNVEVMYDRGKKARQALANIKAVMGEAG